MKEMNYEFLHYASGVLGDTKFGLNNQEIDTYLGKYASKFNIKGMRNARLMQSKKDKIFHGLFRFTEEQKYQIIDELCSLERFEENGEVQELRNFLHERYSNYAPQSIMLNPVVNKTKHWLEKYPKAFEEYENALKKYDNNIFERNTLDDMRLSFGLLVKYLLKNEKSLENQIPEIGSRLKEVGASVELRNMVQQVIKYYTDFQNNHVKHNDVVNKNEIEYIIELTSVVMKFLIKITEGANQQ